MSYLDGITNDEIYTGPHSLETYFAEDYVTEPMYESTALSEKNKRPVLKNVDFDHYENQYHPVRPPRGFIKYKTISPPEPEPEPDSDEEDSDDEMIKEFIRTKSKLKNKEKIKSRKKHPKSRYKSVKEFFGGSSECSSSGLRMIDIFVLILICILMVMQVKINWRLELMTSLHRQGPHPHHPNQTHPTQTGGLYNQGENSQPPVTHNSTALSSA